MYLITIRDWLDELLREKLLFCISPLLETSPLSGLIEGSPMIDCSVHTDYNGEGGEWIRARAWRMKTSD